MSRDVKVFSENIYYIYECSGMIFDMDEYLAAPICRMDKYGLAAQGYLCFDREIENIVIMTTHENGSFADTDFASLVMGRVKVSSNSQS